MKLPDEILKVVEDLIYSRIHLTRAELDRAGEEEYEGMIDEQSLVPSDRHIACCSRFLEMCKGRDIDMDAAKIEFRRSSRRELGDWGNNLSVRTVSFVVLIVTKSEFTFIKRENEEREKGYCDLENDPHVENPLIDVERQEVVDRYVFNGNSWKGETETISSWRSNYEESSAQPHVVKSVKEFDLGALKSCRINMFWDVNCYDKKGDVIRDCNCPSDFEDGDSLTSNEEIDECDDLP